MDLFPNIHALVVIIFTPHACARGKVISCVAVVIIVIVVVIVSTKIAISQDLDI